MQELEVYMDLLDVTFGCTKENGSFEEATTANGGLVCSFVFLRHKTRRMGLLSLSLSLDPICFTFHPPVVAKLATICCDNETILFRCFHTGKHSFPGGNHAAADLGNTRFEALVGRC
jgi:hypothetical protein